MTQEKIDKANKLQRDIARYETVIRYAITNHLVFTGMIGTEDLSDDKDLASIIYHHCKKVQYNLTNQFEEL